MLVSRREADEAEALIEKQIGPIDDLVSDVATLPAVRFTDVTGVKAAASGTGVRLESSGFGTSEFTSVNVRDW